MMPPINDPFWIVIGFIALAVIGPFFMLGIYMLAEKLFDSNSCVSSRLSSIKMRRFDRIIPRVFFYNIFKTIPYIAIFQMLIGSFLYYSFEDEPIASNIVWAMPILIWISIVYLSSHKGSQNFKLNDNH